MIKIYPAVCAREENGYSVFLPDFNNVATCGDDLEDAISMATDLIAVMIYSNREEGLPVPAPSRLEDINPKDVADWLDSDYDPLDWAVLPVCVDAEEYAEHNFGETVAIRVRISTSTWNAVCDGDEVIDIDKVADEAFRAAVIARDAAI